MKKKKLKKKKIEWGALKQKLKKAIMIKIKDRKNMIYHLLRLTNKIVRNSILKIGKIVRVCSRFKMSRKGRNNNVINKKRKFYWKRDS